MKHNNSPTNPTLQQSAVRSRSNRKAVLLFSLTLLLLTTLACSFSVDFTEGSLSINSGNSPAEETGDTAAAQATDIPTDALPPETYTAAASPQPNQAHTPTPASVVLEVDQDTFCRTGPASIYPKQSILNTDQSALALARDPGETSWLIIDPDNETQECWIWGRYATPQGPADSLPVFTPPPSPTVTPGLDFTAYKDFKLEGSTGVSFWFRIENTGVLNLESVRTVVKSKTKPKGESIQDQTATSMYNGFAGQRNPNDPNIQDTAEPGAKVGTKSGRMDFIHGNTATVTITVCSQDGLQGICKTKTFTIETD
jgi:hypothetical protein